MRSSGTELSVVGPAAYRQTLVALAREPDEYTQAVGGIDIRVVRTGKGRGPNLVRTARELGITATSVQVGFPMIGRTAIAEDMVVVARLRSTPPGTQWCGVTLDQGATIVYGPEALHTSVNPVGTEFSFAAVRMDDLAIMADSLAVDLAPPKAGEVRHLSPTPELSAIVGEFGRLAESSTEGIPMSPNHPDDLLATMVALLVDGRRGARVRTGRAIDSRQVVHRCYDYAEEIRRIPSIRELCSVAHVSERTLRSAFTEACGMAPSKALRVWALGRARAALLDGDNVGATVSDVAMNVGFTHLGRFAARYRAVFGEYPSNTLRSARAA